MSMFVIHYLLMKLKKIKFKYLIYKIALNGKLRALFMNEDFSVIWILVRQGSMINFEKIYFNSV